MMIKLSIEDNVSSYAKNSEEKLDKIDELFLSKKLQFLSYERRIGYVSFESYDESVLKMICDILLPN